METICSKCGVKLAERDVLYSSDAQVVCAACYAQADLVETDRRAAANIVRAAWAALGAGAVSLVAPLAMLGVITYFFIAAALISGIFATQSMARGNERFTNLLASGQRTMVWVCSIVGITLAGLSLLGVGSMLALYVIGRS